MKIFLIGMLVFSAVLYSCGPTHVIVSNDYPEPAPAPPPPAPEVSYQSFYDELSPYGTWIDYPGYGYVWMPSVDPGFKPYSSDGHWVYTDAGWTWASDYNWGWATFHYGRWFYENGYGWMWKPGYEWAPAWVSWRRSPDYYGWAPLGPNTSVGISISNYEPPNNYWSFVPQRYVNNPHVNNYYVNETKNVTIINNTTVINNNTTNNTVNNNYGSNNQITNNNTVNNNSRIVYANGPDPREVETATGTSVRPIAIRETNRPGVAQTTNGQLSIYRPRVNASPATNNNNGSSGTLAPARVVALRDIRPSSNNNGMAPNTSQTPSRFNAGSANSTNPNQATRSVNDFHQPAPVPNTNNPNSNQGARPVNSFQQPPPASNNPNPNQGVRPVNSFQQEPPPSNTNNANPNQPARPFNRFQQPPANPPDNNTNPNRNFRQANDLQPANSRPAPVDRNTYPPVQPNRQNPPPPQKYQSPPPARPRLLAPSNVNNNRVAQPQPQVQVGRAKPAPDKPVTQNPPPPDKKPKEEK